MEEEECEECRSLEDEIYWSHFQSLHFFQILPPDFHNHLAIPETFSRNLKKKLPKVVILKGPSGSTWEVGLTVKSSVMFFTQGWFEFAIEHLLCEKDLLVFKYNGESQFDVLVFDGNSLCEKVSTYFVRKCGHRKNRNDCQAKRKITDISVDDINSPEKTVIQDTAAEEIASDNTDEIPLTISSMEPIPTRRIRQKLMTHGLPAHETASDDVDEVSVRVPIAEYRAFKSIWQKIKVMDPYMRRQSTRIEATPAEKEAMKENALRVGRAAVTKEGFFVVMKPTNLFPKFNVAVPTEWVKKRFINPRTQNVILCFKDRSWCVNFLYYRKRKRSTSFAFRAYLCRGWRAFAVENKLKEFDVCVFEPETPASVPLRLSVDIIRGHLEDHNDCQTMRQTRETSVDVISATPRKVDQHTPGEKISSADIEEVCIMEYAALQRIQQKVDFIKPSNTEQSTRVEPPPGFLDVNAIANSPSVVVQALPAHEAPNDDDIHEIQLVVPTREDTDHKKIDTVEPSYITNQSSRNDAHPVSLCEAPPPCFINEAPTCFIDINSIIAPPQVIAQASPVDKIANNDTHKEPLRLPTPEGKAPRNIWQKIELKGPSITKLSKRKKASPAFLDVDTVTSYPKASTDGTGEIPSRAPITENKAHKRIWQKIDLMEVSVAKQSTRNEAPPGFPETDSEPDVQHGPVTPDSLVQNVLKKSSKRLTTEKEKIKDTAIRAAQAAVTRDGFFVIMKPTYLYPKFFVVIPIHWMRKQLINPIKQSVILCVEDRTWNVQFLCYDGHGGANEKLRGVLSAGWKKFALDNKLKEFDGCVFEPADTPPDVPYQFNVNIIRCCPEQEGSK